MKNKNDILRNQNNTIKLTYKGVIYALNTTSISTVYYMVLLTHCFFRRKSKTTNYPIYCKKQARIIEHELRRRVWKQKYFGFVVDKVIFNCIFDCLICDCILDYIECDCKFDLRKWHCTYQKYDCSFTCTFSTPPYEVST